MTTDAAIFVPRAFKLHDLALLFQKTAPTTLVQVASPDSLQLVPNLEGKEYVEITDASLSGNDLDDFPAVWEQNGAPPAEAVYCAAPGFFQELGSKPKQISLWGNPREFVKAVLMSFTADVHVWVMMYNGKITRGEELRELLATNAFFDSSLPW